MACDGPTMVAAWLGVVEMIRDRRDELVRLDREIGDGDHGENLRRGFDAVGERLAALDAAAPGEVLKSVATTLISTVGGAAGPLFGTALLRAAKAVGDRDVLDGVAVAEALAASAQGVVARGRAEVGDKTMVDALIPAVKAAESAAQRGEPVAGVLAEAARAAARGAQDTVELVARKGRASYLGPRSAGHLDPGARSTELILTSLAAAAGSSGEDS